MKDKFQFFLAVLFACSLAGNIYLIWGKGIVVNHYTTNHQEQYQQQWSGQLMMNMYMAQGDKIEWRYKKYSDFGSIDEIISFKNSLPPQSSYFSKPEFIPSTFKAEEYDIYFTWPDIYTKTKESVK